MLWVVCKWNAETNESVIIDNDFCFTRNEALEKCILLAEKEAETPPDLLWKRPLLKEDSERERYYAVDNNGCIDLFHIKGTFIQSGWITSEVRNFERTTVAQYFPLKVPQIWFSNQAYCQTESTKRSENTHKNSKQASQMAWNEVVAELQNRINKKKNE